VLTTFTVITVSYPEFSERAGRWAVGQLGGLQSLWLKLACRFVGSG